MINGSSIVVTVVMYSHFRPASLWTKQVPKGRALVRGALGGREGTDSYTTISLSLYIYIHTYTLYIYIERER